MKKTFLLTLLIALVLSLSLIIHADEGYDETEYPGVKVMEDYLEENIDNYFLPVAYDLTRIYDSADDYQKAEYFYVVNKIYTERLTLDENGRITVPPIEEAFAEEFNPIGEFSKTGWFMFYIVDLDDPQYEESLTTAMRRSIMANKNDSSAIKRAFAAPWTLFDNGELYTFPELMAMSETELEALDFKTPDFAKFIANVKGELESRGWWKEEYQAKYDILYAHRDDYKNSLDESENFTIDGETYNFATMYYEYKIDGSGNVSNILNMNFYEKGFGDIINNASAGIKEKYRDMFDDILQRLNSDTFNEYLEAPYVTYDWISYLYMLNDYEIDIPHIELSSTSYMCNIIMYRDNYDMDVVRDGVERYCFELNSSIPEYRIDMFVSGDLRESMKAFSFYNALILNPEEDWVIDVMDLKWSDETSYFLGKEDDITNIEDIISDIENFMNYLKKRGVSVKAFEDDIEYLKSLKTPPKTGDNSVLYVIIAAASLTAMSAMVFRKKRKVTE